MPFSTCHQTLKKIAMRSPLGTANVFAFCSVPLAQNGWKTLD